MNKNIFLFTTLALLIGFGSGYLIAGREPGVGEHVMSNGGLMDDVGITMGSSMEDMTAALSGKTGDEFDKAFLAGMLIHHEGAVEMAEAALVSANHEEIKEMAKAIIDTQSKEISQMRAWETEWYQIGE